MSKSDNTESVSIDTVKILINSLEKVISHQGNSQQQALKHQEKTLNRLSDEIRDVALENKETNKNLLEIINLVKEDGKTTKNILTQHINEYNRNEKQNNVRFKNLFQRQDAIDSILKEREPMWLAARTGGRFGKFFVSAIILSVAGAAGANLYQALYKKEPIKQESKQTEPAGKL